MRWMVIVAVVLVGCAQSPSQVREAKNTQQFTLAADYRIAGNCVLRQFEEVPQFTNNVIWDDRRRAAEVITKLSGTTLWVVDLEEAANAVRATAYLPEIATFPSRTHSQLKELLARCM